ncbi:uncharacterized protein LAJ45_08079 [Morchella importuna]|uniref:Uncharacterized protein n=1 Tax=Morchella conica CCBAS932 TaxID=1392247 RepID=A0A3N4KSF2_9PEZI|nr:uncharacterized protein LAJ45_08079 [Morchella importuna]KAH8147977.1 hypothetical protein LAJ45_08079 [Morchella importuna]RPB13437.1 hypothetical protein P167DRAFT_114775 [Morchella conica CCBAS932]
MSRPRRSRNLLVPIGISVTAAVVGLGLYFWQQNSSPASSSSGPVPQDQELSDHTRAGEEDGLDQSQAKQRPNPTGSGNKRTVVVVVREGAPGLLWNIPTPLNLKTTNVFILVHSPQSGGKPENAYKVIGNIFPADYPREYVLPYTIDGALLPLIRHLAPEVVYMDESLVGEDAASVTGLLEGNWVGAVVVATGDRSGSSEWRQNVQRFGRRCAVVDRSGIRGDWAGRVG